MDMFENTGVDRAHIIESVRLIGEGKHWDALEILRRNVDDEGVRQAIELAQFKVEMPW
jgi:hypothetical protein